MSLVEKYPKEVKAIFSKYPTDQKRSAIMPLLYLAQREDGYVTKESMQDVANIIDVDVTEVASIIGFYTLYHDEKGGKYRMQVCNDLPCALLRADQLLEALFGNLCMQVRANTTDCLVTIEAGICPASCSKSLMLQIQDG